jgi:hypothetical protein
MPTARTDLSGVSFLSAAGLGVLGRTHQPTRTDGTSPRVVTAVGCVHLVLHLTDLDRRTCRRAVAPSSCQELTVSSTTRPHRGYLRSPRVGPRATR